MAPAARRICSSSSRFIPCGLAIDLPALDRSEDSAERVVLTQAFSFLGFVEQNASDFGPGALQDRHPLHRRKVAPLDPSRTDLPGMLESLPHGIAIDLRHDAAGHRQAAPVDGVVRLHDAILQNEKETQHCLPFPPPPPVDNLNLNIPDGGGNAQAPYHGYAARDFKRVEEHFGDTSNTWSAFDALVFAAHTAGIKVIVDFAPNHSNDNNAGEYGSLYDAGTFMAAYNNDPNGYFHHNPNITDWNDRYQLQYYTLFNLSELNQENATIDGYLKAALTGLASHGADAFRIDAAKHITWGWEYSMNNAIFNNAPSFIFGEWYQGNSSDALYHDSYKFANHSGMSLLDFPLNTAIRDVFASNNAFSEIDSTLTTETANFRRGNALVTFIDNP